MNHSLFNVVQGVTSTFDLFAQRALTVDDVRSRVTRRAADERITESKALTRMFRERWFGRIAFVTLTLSVAAGVVGLTLKPASDDVVLASLSVMPGLVLIACQLAEYRMRVRWNI
ncbi:hypothetical protein KTD31_01225 [Burkholderia multivorans]|uniref:hypothetical protein n=1 Tax=Burkholderia multivorans TaxID=87883 RepID=UPI001C21BA0C|nr:hypothetical protein [Burkholderia multivorans]MBU9200023.1 hypothetical protein [Burkholderia multivorans]MDN8078858.1 hypothetical protein [Burkholderia multivorans]